MTVKTLLGTALAAALLFTGCSSQGGSAEAKNVEPAAAADAILNEVEFRDSLVKAEDGAAEGLGYRLDDTIADYAIYISGSGATAEEIAVLKVAEGAGTDDAKKILEKRVEDLKFRFEDYVPEEMVKLNDPVIVTGGNVAILVLADDSAAAKKAAEAQL